MAAPVSNINRRHSSEGGNPAKMPLTLPQLTFPLTFPQKQESRYGGLVVFTPLGCTFFSHVLGGETLQKFSPLPRSNVLLFSCPRGETLHKFSPLPRSNALFFSCPRGEPCKNFHFATPLTCNSIVPQRPGPAMPSQHSPLVAPSSSLEVELSPH